MFKHKISIISLLCVILSSAAFCGTYQMDAKALQNGASSPKEDNGALAFNPTDNQTKVVTIPQKIDFRKGGYITFEFRLDGKQTTRFPRLVDSMPISIHIDATLPNNQYNLKFLLTGTGYRQAALKLSNEIGKWHKVEAIIDPVSRMALLKLDDTQQIFNLPPNLRLHDLQFSLGTLSNDLKRATLNGSIRNLKIEETTPYQLSSLAKTKNSNTIKSLDLDIEKEKVFKSDRADGRFDTTRGILQHLLRTRKPELAFNPNMNKEEFVIWQGKVKERLAKMLLKKFPEQPAPKLLSKEKRNGYTLEKWEHYPMPGAVVPFLMLIPDGVNANNPAPVVMCIPGTNRSKESMAGEKDLHPAFETPKYHDVNKMALEYTKAGMVTVTMDNPSYGETSDVVKLAGNGNGADVHTICMYLFGMDWSYMGLATYQNNQLMQWVKNLPFIDKNKIATSGHSLGAWQAMYLAIFNPEVSAVVLNQNIYNWYESVKVRTKPGNSGRRPGSFGTTFVYPGMYDIFDHPDLLASLAPRAVLCTEGLPSKDTEMYQKAYQIMGAPENFKVIQFKKYESYESRHHAPLQEGLSDAEFWHQTNNDGPDHYFKGQYAVPWLKKQFNLN